MGQRRKEGKQIPKLKDHSSTDPTILPGGMIKSFGESSALNGPETILTLKQSGGEI